MTTSITTNTQGGTSAHQSNLGPTFAILVLAAVTAAIVSLAAIFSMPAFKCDRVEVKFFEFANEDNQRAIDHCTKAGGELQPTSGFMLGGLSGLVFFGAAGAAVYVARRTNSPASPSSSSREWSQEPKLNQRPPAVVPVKVGATNSQAAPLGPSAAPRLSQADSPRTDQATTVPNRLPSPFALSRSLAERLQDARPASFVSRVPAFIIDLLLIAMLAFIVIAVVQLPFSNGQRGGPALGGVYVLVIAATFIVYEWIAAVVGGTPGMRAMGMRIIRVDGTATDSVSALWRAVVLFLSSLIIAGPLSGLWHKEGRAWHDLASGTGVVRL